MKILFRKGLAFFLVFTMIITLGVGTFSENELMADEVKEEALNTIEDEEVIEIIDDEAIEVVDDEEIDIIDNEDEDEEIDTINDGNDEEDEIVTDEDIDMTDDGDEEELPPRDVEETTPSESDVIVEEANSTENLETKDETEGLAEYFPAVLEPPITLPAHYFQNRIFNIMSGGLKDTIEVDKTAERADCGCRTYEVTLSITGTPQQAPVDVVLILDRSGSMSDSAGSGNYAYYPIMQAPSTNSNYYVKVDGQYRQVSYSYGGIVWYYGSGNNRRYVSWNPGGDDNGSGGNSNNPTPKPFYIRGNTRLHHAKEAAINFAAKVLGSEGIPGSRISVVSYSGPSSTSGSGNQNQARTDRGLTDDLSLVVNAINGLSASGGTNTQAGFLQGKGVIENSGNPNSNKVVIMFTDGLPTASNGNRYAETTDSNHVHVTTAIAAGKGIFENNIADVFTIGLLQNMTNNERTLARHILNQTQNKGFHEAPSAEDLDGIFDSISEELGYAATNAKVVDKIGNNFNLVEDSLPAGASYNPSTREITWNPGTIVNEAELKYKVQAKPDFPGGWADTNEYAKLTYTDIFGESGKEKVFPVPEVDVPAPLAVSLTDATIHLGESINLGSGTDPDGENYMSPITGGDGDGTYTYEWRIKGETEVLSNAKNPEVNPEEDTIYELTVIDSNGCKAIAEMQVKVIQHQDAIPDEPLIRVSKTFEGLTQEEINQLDGFRINIKSQDGSKDKDLHLEDATAGPIDEDGKITYVWEIEGWPAGTYIIEEFGYNHEFYEVEVDNDGTVTTVAATITLETAPRVKTNTEVNNDLTFNDQYPPPNLVAAKLTANRGIFVWTETRLSASQRLAVVGALKNVNQLGLTIDNGVWYSGEDDIAGNNFYFRGYKVQYNLDTGNLNLPQSNQWALIVSASYGFEGGDAADIAVKNTYTVKTVDVTIEKEVTGNYGDMQGEFEFEVSVSGEESPRTFSLAHGEFEKLENIPINALLTLSEEARGHEVSVWIGEEQIQAEDGEYEIDLTEYDGNITIKVVNHRDEVIDTGIMLDSMPYILILAGVTVGLGIKIVRRKRFQ